MLEHQHAQGGKPGTQAAWAYSSGAGPAAVPSIAKRSTGQTTGNNF